MTIGELKKLIANTPDDHEVVISVDGGHDVYEAGTNCDGSTAWAVFGHNDGWAPSKVFALELGSFLMG